MNFHTKSSKVARMWGLVLAAGFSGRFVRSVERRLADGGHNRPHRLVYSSLLRAQCGQEREANVLDSKLHHYQPPGSGGMRPLLTQLKDAGYESIRILAERKNGANPGLRDITISLK
jgi:hypothetical protein